MTQPTPDDVLRETQEDGILILMPKGIKGGHAMNFVNDLLRKVRSRDRQLLELREAVREMVSRYELGRFSNDDIRSWDNLDNGFCVRPIMLPAKTILGARMCLPEHAEKPDA